MSNEDALLYWQNINSIIHDEIRKYRPKMSDTEIDEAFTKHKIQIICARGSNWPFGKPYIPPKIIFEEGFLNE